LPRGRRKESTLSIPDAQTLDPAALRARIAAETEAFAEAIAGMNADEADRIHKRIEGLRAQLANASPTFDTQVTR